MSDEQSLQKINQTQNVVDVTYSREIEGTSSYGTENNQLNKQQTQRNRQSNKKKSAKKKEFIELDAYTFEEPVDESREEIIQENETLRNKKKQEIKAREDPSQTQE